MYLVAHSNLKSTDGHPTLVIPLTALSPSHSPCLQLEHDRLRKRECVFLFWARKAFSHLRMLPLKLKKWVSCGGNDHRIDKAWSRHHVPNIFLSTGHLAAERAAGHCGIKSFPANGEVSGRFCFGLNGLKPPDDTKSSENALAICFAGI